MSDMDVYIDNELCPICEWGYVVKCSMRLTRPYRHVAALEAAYSIDVPKCTNCNEIFFDRQVAAALNKALEQALNEANYSSDHSDPQQAMLDLSRKKL